MLPTFTEEDEKIEKERVRELGSQKLKDPTFFQGAGDQLLKTPFRMAESLISFALPDDYKSPFRHDPQTQGTVAGWIDQMSVISAYIAPCNVGKYLGAGATAMKFVKAGGLANMATSKGAESRRDYLQKGVDSSTALKMGAIEGIGQNFFSIFILYMILSFWGKPFLKAIYTRIIDTMNKMHSKIDFIITSFIAWVIAWAIPLTYTGRSYISDYYYGKYMAFGLWILIPFCLLSSYCSHRILTNSKIKEYIQERWNELKHPIFVILLCFFLVYIIPLTGRLMYKLYCAKSFIGGFINLAKLFLANTFLSTLYMQFYKTFRNKEIS